MNFGMMNGANFMGTSTGMAFGGLTMFVWLALLLGLIVLVARWLGNGRSGTH